MNKQETIIVDENIERNLQKRKQQSIYEINNGVGLWGLRALDYIYSDDAPSFVMRFELEGRGLEGMNEYGKMIDRLASELQERITNELLATPQYALNDDYMHNVQTYNAVRAIAEEEIWSQLIRVEELIVE